MREVKNCAGIWQSLEIRSSATDADVEAALATAYAAFCFESGLEIILWKDERLALFFCVLFTAASLFLLTGRTDGQFFPDLILTFSADSQV